MTLDLTDRHTYIGASDAAAILGLSRWRTPLEVWAEKTQTVPRTEEENIPAEIGNELEDYVARKWSQRTGKKVHRVNEAFAHKKFPFIKAHIDRKVEGENSILQCKTCSAYKYAEWEGEEMPLDYIIQEYVELACSGYDRAYIYVLIGNNKFEERVIERDDKAMNDIIEKLGRFWIVFVAPKVMPQTVTYKDGEILQGIYPEAKEDSAISLSDEVNAIIESIEGMKRDRDALEKQIDKEQNGLKLMLKDADTGTTGLWKLRWYNVPAAHVEFDKKASRTFRYWPIKQEDK